ncbi:MAG: formate/nitrite transporter family protein [Duncaniella sp.]|nr:formate/nitrite transporter family protein [Muribaculum sp.]MCM1255156.1 formate/nitrite transporter family protein [Duncaniella sp.]
MQIRTPREITEAAATAGAGKARLTANDTPRLLVSAILAGAYIALGGILSMIVGFGFPGITEANPSLQKLLSGCMFPIGLILVVVLGAELFTGNNALLIPSYARKEHSTSIILKNWTLVYFGNFAGAILFTYFLVYLCGLTAAEPYHSAAIKVACGKVAMPWIVVLIKGIGANWCVCLAVWLALSGKTFFEKALGCWIPVMAFVALGYEHSIANMFFIPLGMMEGADISVGTAIIANLIPATIGNIIGGALFVGAVNAYIHFKGDK